MQGVQFSVPSVLLPKAACKEWEECMQILLDFQEAPETITNRKKGEPISLASAMCLLRGNAFEAFENRLFATACYKQALIYDKFCFEAFDRLTTGHLLSYEEGKSYLLYSNFPETTLLDSMAWTEETQWLKEMYRAKIKKYDPTPVPENKVGFLFVHSSPPSVDIKPR